MQGLRSDCQIEYDCELEELSSKYWTMSLSDLSFVDGSPHPNLAVHRSGKFDWIENWSAFDAMKKLGLLLHPAEAPQSHQTNQCHSATNY